MGKIKTKKRHMKIIKKHKRHEKLRKLAIAYFRAKTQKTRNEVLEKIQKIAPELLIQDYLGIKQ